MILNPNWQRWIFASVGYHLKTEVPSVTSIVEGLEERNQTFLETSIRAEIRVNGPFLKEQNKEYRVWTDANVLITAHMEDDAAGRYEIHRIAGLYAEALAKSIEVWNYGDQPGDFEDGDPDSQTLIGCLVNRRGRSDMIECHYFGQVESTDRVLQAMVNAPKEMFV